MGWPLQPNGSRLSCGRNGRWRKAVERQTKRLAGEATQFLPTCERPPASSACYAATLAMGEIQRANQQNRNACCVEKGAPESPQDRSLPPEHGHEVVHPDP